jgi:hypothetical protein
VSTSWAQAAVCILLAGAGLVAGQAGTPAVPGPTDDVVLTVLGDGRLGVTEKVSVPAGRVLVREVPLRVPDGDDRVRVYTVRDAAVRGEGTVELRGDRLVLTVRGGQSSVTYTVGGAIADLPGQQQVRWQVAGGWDADLARLTASLRAPAPGAVSVDCFAGPSGSSQQCSLAEVGDTGAARVEQEGLRAGDRVELAVGLPAGTVPAGARFAAVASPATAFVPSPVTTRVAAVLLVLLLGGVGWARWLRRRDAVVGSAPARALVRDGDRACFAAPHGVLPGHLSTVLGGTPGVVDLSATVVDLAVRGHLRIEEVVGGNGFPDWRLSRTVLPEGRLHPFERAVLDVVLPAGSTTVSLSGLRARGTADPRAACEAIRADVVRRRWFSRRPGTRSALPARTGLGLLGAGAVATVVLAFTVGEALLGVAVAVAGLALALGSGSVPARTGRGRALAREIGGLGEFLRTTGMDTLVPADPEPVFSRALPYAVAMGEAERWLTAFAGLDPAGLHWFAGSGSDPRRFAAHFGAFLGALGGLLAEAEHLRAIGRTEEPEEADDPVPA